MIDYTPFGMDNYYDEILVRLVEKHQKDWTKDEAYEVVNAHYGYDYIGQHALDSSWLYNSLCDYLIQEIGVIEFVELLNVELNLTEDEILQYTVKEHDGLLSPHFATIRDFYISNDLRVDFYFRYFSSYKPIRERLKIRAKELDMTIEDYIFAYGDIETIDSLYALKIVKQLNKKLNTRISICKVNKNNIYSLWSGTGLYTVNNGISLNIDSACDEIIQKLQEIEPLFLRLFSQHPTEDDWYEYLAGKYYKYEEIDETRVFNSGCRLTKFPEFNAAKRRYLMDSLGIPESIIDTAISANQVYCGPGVYKQYIHYFAGGRGGAYGNNYSYWFEKNATFTRMYRDIMDDSNSIRIDGEYAEIDEYYLTTREQLAKDLYEIATPEQRQKYFDGVGLFKDKWRYC